MLFNLYDTDGSGTLDYKEFSAVLFGKASNQASPWNNPEALA